MYPGTSWVQSTPSTPKPSTRETRTEERKAAVPRATAVNKVQDKVAPKASPKSSTRSCNSFSSRGSPRGTTLSDRNPNFR
jgi:hypothetical protein